jgi:hypothetical protein
MSVTQRWSSGLTEKKSCLRMTGLTGTSHVVTQVIRKECEVTLMKESQCDFAWQCHR